VDYKTVMQRLRVHIFYVVSVSDCHDILFRCIAHIAVLSKGRNPVKLFLSIYIGIGLNFEVIISKNLLSY